MSNSASTKDIARGLDSAPVRAWRAWGKGAMPAPGLTIGSLQSILTGVLTAGDTDIFDKMAARYRSAVVSLNSDGGSLVTGIQIRESIRQRRFDIGRLNHLPGDHQKALRRHHRLRVVALMIFNNDSTLTSAILDRVLHHAETVIIEGTSFRMKDEIDE
jgi:hypothetical protein